MTEFVARVANLADPSRGAVVFLGGPGNTLLLRLHVAGAAALVLDPGGAATGPVIEIAFAADVATSALAAANVAVEVASGGGSPEAAPVEASFDAARGLVSIHPRKRLPLRLGDMLAVTLRDVVLPVDYSHVPVVLTVAWEGLLALDPTGSAVRLDRDGRALVLEPRPAPGLRDSGGPAPLSVGWLAQAGARALGPGRPGEVVVTPPPPVLADSPTAGLARAATAAAARAREDIVPTVGGPGFATAVAQAQQVATLGRAFDQLLADARPTPVLMPPPPIVNRLAFRLQNNSDTALFGDDGSRRRPSFAIGMTTAESPAADHAYDALCTADEAADVQCRIYGDGKTTWSIEQDRAKGQWVLTPRSRDVLGPHEAIVVALENLVTTLPAHPTGLYIAHRDLPGYDDGVLALPIEKVLATPMIAEFGVFADGEPVNTVPGLLQGQEIEVRWRCLGVPPGYDDAVELEADDPAGGRRSLGAGLAASGSYREVPTAALTTYRLRLRVPNGPPDAFVRVRIIPVTLQTGLSNREIERGDTAALVYRTTGATKLTITPDVTRVPTTSADAPGTGAFLVSPTATTSYRLQAEGFGGPVSADWLIVVRDPPVNRLLFLTTAGIVDNKGLPVVPGLSAASVGAMFTDAGRLLDFAMEADTPRYLLAGDDDSNGPRVLPDRLPPVYYSENDFTPAVAVSLVSVGGRVGAATQTTPPNYVGGPVSFFAPMTGQPWLVSYQSGNGEPAMQAGETPFATWLAPDQSGEIVLVRFAPTLGFLALDRDARLWRCPAEPAGAGALVAEKVESFAVDRSDRIYWVNVRHELMLTDRADGTAVATKLADVPGISTRIVVQDDTVYWAENDGRFGPTACCWTLAAGCRLGPILPGRVPFNGVTVRSVQTGVPEASDARVALG